MVRPLGRLDYELIHFFWWALEAAKEAANWSISDVMAEVESYGSLGYFSDGALAAILLYREIPGAREISWLATHPGCRRRGHMGELLGHLDALAPRRTIWLELRETNEKALALYKSKGFRQVGHRPSYYSDGEGALLMERACF